ncbi:hypothetical protein Z517_05797 [Fonsecaea pedrosoi CBS 271.37]|uniref:Unplaced genomic scaffold supercont1.4, whole genome shotgun sequence n=1 Tax=Fonsecaea pedrosoi CBS 271.37 TaxID=1442368 RepID=A0A0D2GKX9_9EURO|nr:uncharacterized protein Z517_05797 [Fonsecaea pedrosoi CBS 271.37]KIW79185.1 hypothetical protein Z517_05797 [Fonsecaea pedrosoi CBS 271.37]
MAAVGPVDEMRREEKGTTYHQHEEIGGSPGTSSEDGIPRDLEKNPSHMADPELDQVSSEDGDSYVTTKTWMVVVTLSFAYGISFWPVPFFSTIQSEIAASFGSAAGLGTWFTSSYIAAATIAFMICGANSDLFGRRAFLLMGNVLVLVGAIVGATSHHMGQSIAAHVLIGFGAGNCQLTTFAIPELLPNKWRHIGVVIADGVAFFNVIAGPVTARIAIRHGDAWRWGYWAMVITIAISLLILVLYYYPPAHPRGIPWGQALRNLDYVGMASFTISAAMVLSGIVYVQLVPSDDPKVIGLLVAGFGCLVFFALWETFVPLKEPLTPPRLFTANKGRRMTGPFIVGFVVTMFYYGTNIIWGEMVSLYFTHADTPPHTVYWLATVQGFGILLGGVFLSVAGNYFKHWQWQMGLSIAWMTLFGGLLAYVTPEREGVGIAFAFLSAAGFGYAQYLSITYIQFGADQIELGIAGGLAGVSRESGGAVAVTSFETILVHVQQRYARQHVAPAAQAAGASPQVAQAVAAALPLGTAALETVQGITPAIVSAAQAAFLESYVQGLKTVALTLTGFGCVAIIACFFIEDIGPRMNQKIEIFLENDVEAHKNKYH